MKDRIIAALNALDVELSKMANGDRLDLYNIGRSALVWKHGVPSTTEGIDVVQPKGDHTLMVEALRLFGKDTKLSREYDLYLEDVPSALPPVWQGCYKRAKEVAEKWTTIRVFHLDDHDFAVTKMKRFAIRDQEDLRAMCDLGLIDPNILRQRMEAAYPFRHDKDEDPGRMAADANVKVVFRYLESGEWKSG